MHEGLVRRRPQGRCIFIVQDEAVRASLLADGADYRHAHVLVLQHSAAFGSDLVDTLSARPWPRKDMTTVS